MGFSVIILPMRVAMIGPFGLRPKGTMGVRALPLAKALAQRGHAAALFLPPWSCPEDAGKAWEEDGVRIENVAITPRASIAPRLVTRAHAWRPDVVHFFKPKAYAGLAQWLFDLRRRLGVSRSRLVLDADDWEGAGGWNDLEHYPGPYKKFFAWQEQWGLRHADAVTVASRALESIVWSLGVPREKVHYLPNGAVRLPRPSPAAREKVRAAHGLANDPVVLLYTRFFDFRVERLVEIFDRIVESAPDTRLLVVGKGFFGEEEKFLALARERGWARQVVYAGWVEQAELPAYFASADIALLPCDDTLINRCRSSVKLSDLLAAGVPVVTEAVGQNKELIVQYESGLLVPPGAVDEFACAAVDLLRDAARRARLAANAAARMEREFSWERLARVAEEAYLAPRPAA